MRLSPVKSGLPSLLEGRHHIVFKLDNIVKLCNPAQDGSATL